MVFAFSANLKLKQHNILHMYIFNPSVLSPATGQSGLLHHNGGQRQKGHYCSLCPDGEEPARCSYGGQTRQPLRS